MTVGVKENFGQDIMIPMVWELYMLYRIGNVGRELPETPCNKEVITSMLHAERFAPYTLHIAMGVPMRMVAVLE